jgi:hypothetical protein
MNALHLEPKMITSANGEKLVGLTLTINEWRQLEEQLNEEVSMPAFASLGAGESDLNAVDSEVWLCENWK